jgi:hypothetical protein
LSSGDFPNDILAPNRCNRTLILLKAQNCIKDLVLGGGVILLLLIRYQLHKTSSYVS